MIDFTNIISWRIGNTEIVKTSINGVVVWSRKALQEPFYVENIRNSAETVKITGGENAPNIEIQVSDDGQIWTDLGTVGSDELTISLPVGSKVYIRPKYQCSRWGWGYQNPGVMITGCSKVGGNIMSLLYGPDFTGSETLLPSPSAYNRFVFGSLFMNNSNLIDAADLILPVNTLESCYDAMFKGCTSLTTAPALPATTLALHCYADMFYGCTSLTTAPALPATTLVNGCYEFMFYECSSLITAPSLPANTLANYCYAFMFLRCTSLTTAPALPATTLVNGCYQSMFNGCTSLTTVKCNAIDRSATYCTDYWLNNVSPSGTFYKNASMNDWPSGQSGIPTGWTVVNL